LATLPKADNNTHTPPARYRPHATADEGRRKAKAEGRGTAGQRIKVIL